MLSQPSANVVHQSSHLPPAGPHFDPNRRDGNGKPGGGGHGNEADGGRRISNREHEGGDCVSEKARLLKGERGIRNNRASDARAAPLESEVEVEGSEGKKAKVCPTKKY